MGQEFVLGRHAFYPARIGHNAKLQRLGEKLATHGAFTLIWKARTRSTLVRSTRDPGPGVPRGQRSDPLVPEDLSDECQVCAPSQQVGSLLAHYSAMDSVMTGRTLRATTEPRTPETTWVSCNLKASQRPDSSVPGLYKVSRSERSLSRFTISW